MAKLRKIHTTRNKQLKPYLFPEGFTLIIDTREQLPLFNSRPTGLNLIHKKLNHGDYSIVGFEDSFSIERKMISDFYSYIGKERKKTVQKMNTFRDMEWVSLVIETTEENLLFNNIYTDLTPEQIKGSLTSFRIRYGIHVYFTNDRKMMERYVLDHAIKYYLVKREV
jgi:ERCC4-type nuclease